MTGTSLKTLLAAVACLLVAAVHAQELRDLRQHLELLQKDRHEYWRKILGDQGYETLTNPDKLTTWPVVANVRLEKEVLRIGERGFLPVGLGHVAEGGKSVGELLVTNSGIDLGLLCGFHADHYLVFTKGSDQLRVLTCRGCGHVAMEFNGKSVAAPLLFGEEFSRVLPTLTVYEDAVMAGMQDQLTPEALRRLMFATSAEYRLSVDQKDDTWIKLNPGDFRLLRELVLASARGGALREKHATRRWPSLSKDVELRFTGKKSVSFTSRASPRSSVGVKMDDDYVGQFSSDWLFQRLPVALPDLAGAIGLVPAK